MSATLEEVEPVIVAARRKIDRADFVRAKELARQVLEENYVIKLPVLASQLAKAYGLEVVEGVFKPEHINVAGFIDFDKKTIAVNSADSAPRKNFTIAHELGHYLLEHSIEDGYTVLLRNTDDMVRTPIEQEANCFAANVLVPEPFLRDYLIQYPRVTDEQLAGVFGVSVAVIRFRKLSMR
ncbi:MAG: ImmA/IrrE family metallo-endopeptidase [Planctomycetaceae bacterium]|jgi:Zn-dependent peptidase ImmA (M78 family)|nr:ImmA/IrrE family metallo-endopeptidase [Planctomycetaceae bacterium]